MFLYILLPTELHKLYYDGFDPLMLFLNILITRHNIFIFVTVTCVYTLKFTEISENAKKFDMTALMKLFSFILQQCNDGLIAVFFHFYERHILGI